MGYVFIRIDEKDKKELKSHAKKMGYPSFTWFLKTAMWNLWHKEKKYNGSKIGRGIR